MKQTTQMSSTGCPLVYSELFLLVGLQVFQPIGADVFFFFLCRLVANRLEEEKVLAMTETVLKAIHG